MTAGTRVRRAGWATVSAVALLGVSVVSAQGRVSASPPALTTGFAKVDTGVTLQYVAQGDPKAAPIVLLHGVGDSWHSWDLVFPHLPPSVRVVAVTLRGHGLSDHPAKGYGRADFAGDVGALIRQLDLKGVTLVGHSLGSFVAQHVAAADREGRIAKLVLVGSGPGTMRDPSTSSELRQYFAAVRDPIDYAFARDFQAGTAHQPLPAAFLETMIGEVQRVPAAVFHELAEALGDPDAAQRLGSIRVPTLLVWGDRDGMFSRGDQDALLGMIRGSRLVTYPDTGHALHWEQPVRFARDLLTFVGR